MTIMLIDARGFERNDHTERIRDAQRVRRAGMARTRTGCRTAARTERRFAFVRGLITSTQKGGNDQ
jgi:hypothetical protein